MAKKDEPKAATTIAEPKVLGTTETASQEEVASTDYVVNVVKYNRARAWVNANKETLGDLKGTHLEAAIRERYEAIGGLVNGKALGRRKVNVHTAAKPAGVVKNMATDEGDK